MTETKFVLQCPAYQRAVEALNQARGSYNERWGETRRFTGRSAGNRLNKIAKAELRVSKEWDRAAARYRKQEGLYI